MHAIFAAKKVDKLISVGNWNHEFIIRTVLGIENQFQQVLTI